MLLLLFNLLLWPAGLFLVIYFALYITGWFSGGVCTSKRRLDGKVVVITGGNTGIGYETALDLGRRGAVIIMGCRNIKKANNAAMKIRTASKEPVHVIELDLASLSSVRKFADEVSKITSKVDILVNNAGIMIGEAKGTEDGLEIHMQVNHLGHFLLTMLLEDSLQKAASEPSSDVRIVNVSSDGHKFTGQKGLDIDDPNFGLASWSYTETGKRFSYHRLYGQSKLAQVYFSLELAKRYENITAYSLHPGAVNTEIARYHQDGFGSIVTWITENSLWIFGKTPAEGAQTTIYCCVDKDAVKNNGHYFVDCQKKDIFPWLIDDRKQKLCWDVSKKLVKFD